MQVLYSEADNRKACLGIGVVLLAIVQLGIASERSDSEVRCGLGVLARWAAVLVSIGCEDRIIRFGLGVHFDALLRLEIVLVHAATELERTCVASILANRRPASYTASYNTSHDSSGAESRVRARSSAASARWRGRRGAFLFDGAVVGCAGVGEAGP